MVEDGTVELSGNSGELGKGECQYCDSTGCTICYTRRIKELEKALMDIKKHMEFASPTGYKMAGAWAIANAALK